MSDNRTSKRPPKKSEAVEVRVSYEEKQAFLEACKRMGRSASAVIRDAMRAYAQFGPMTRLPGRTTMIVSAFAGAALGAWALISVLGWAGSDPSPRVYGSAEFRRIDSNHDQGIDAEEFYARQPGPQEIFLLNPSSENSHRRASLLSMFGFYGLDPRVFVDHADRVSAICWADLTDRDRMVQDAQFRQIDANGDQRVTRLEFSNAKAARWRDMFQQLDRNGDGILDGADRPVPDVSVDGNRIRYSARTAVTTQVSEGLPEAVNVRPRCDREREFGSALPVLSDRDRRSLTSHSERTYQCSDCSWNTVARAEDLNGDGHVTFEEYASAQES